MKRRTNWPAALSQFVEDRRDKHFTWGEHDCCLFVCDWILLCTGTDPAKPFRGTYSDALGAARVLKDRGGVEAIAERACSESGWAEIPRAKAQRGDVVSVETENGISLALCLGAVAAVPALTQLAFVPSAQWLRAWAIR